MGTADPLVSWALGQVGTVEGGGPHGNDGNIVHYWDDDHMHWCQGQPWCDAFCSAGFLACGIAVPVMAYCPASMDWYRAHGRLVAAAQAQPGDQLFYAIGAKPWPGHTGICVQPAAGGAVVAVEGNTSPSIVGSQSNGGGVYRRTRPLASVMAAGRPPYDLPRPAPVPIPGPSPIVTARFTLEGEPVARRDLAIPTDASGNGWLPPMQDIDEAKVLAVTVGGARPAADGRYFPGEGHWANEGGHPLVSVTGASPSAQVAVHVVFGE